MGGRDEIALLDLSVHKTATLIKALEANKRLVMCSLAEKLALPLADIKHTLEHLRSSGHFARREKESLDAADRSVDRLVRMVSDLIFLDNEQTRFKLKMEEIKIDEVIQQSIQAVSKAASDKRIEIEAAATSVLAWADADRLVQVVANLLSNAVKFSPADSVIKIGIEEMEHGIRISVRDRGRGNP